MVAWDWSTSHLVNRPVSACTATSPSVRPVSSMPARIHTATCHFVIGPYTCHVTLSVQYGCHVSACPYSRDATCHPVSGATWHLHFAKFSCFTNTTERDNFLIRSPFEVKRMSLELYRRDLRYGASFAEIGGLQNFFLLGSS